jgi:hypothetical protein
MRPKRAVTVAAILVMGCVPTSTIDRHSASVISQRQYFQLTNVAKSHDPLRDDRLRYSTDPFTWVLIRNR